MSAKRAKRRKQAPKCSRRAAFKAAAAVCIFFILWCIAGSWFVHHSRKWIARRLETWPRFATAPLMLVGQPVGEILDALGVTGHDAVYEYDVAAPSGEVFFAGAPVRIGSPAPDDIQIIDRRDFKIGWSPKLRHPVWVAYHVPKDAAFPLPKRPQFSKDPSIKSTPPAESYRGSNFDRGHMAPNYAIATRFGPEAQRRSFLMSNIAPQSASLNRGVWREVERRIADLWTARYGEIWVIVGSIPSAGFNRIGTTGIDIPDAYYQVIVAQEGLDVRALALIYPQYVKWRAWPSCGIISIDELEELSGFDFLPELPDFIQTPLEAELPSRLWPINIGDIFSFLSIHYISD